MKTFIGKLSSWAYLTLLKVYFWAQKSAFKKALDLKALSVRVLDSEVRVLEPSLLQIGEKDNDDDLVEYVSRNLTQRQMIQGIENAAHLRSELAAELITRSKQSKSTCEAISTYFLAEAFTASLLKDDERKDICLNNARQFIPDACPLEVNSLYKIYAKLRKRFSVIRAELAERSAIKIDFHVSSLISLLGVVSALLILSGYLCTTILLGAFGIDASFFFSLPDYLAASIEQIRHAAFPTVIGLVMFVLGLRHGSMQSKMALQFQREQRAREGKWILAFAVVLFGKVVWGLYNDVPFIFEMQTLGVLASFWFAEQIAFKFFAKPLPAQVFLIALFTFISYTGTSLYQQIHDFKAGKWEGRDTVKVSLKKTLSVASTSLVVIAASSNYIFVLSKENKSAYAIPRENIDLAEMEWGKKN